MAAIKSSRCYHSGHLGFMWFGTQDGLARYDGLGFEIYRPDKKDSLSKSASWITSLHEDKAGDLWVTTSDNGVNKLERKTGRFVYYMHDPEDSTTLSNNFCFTSFLDSHDQLWVVSLWQQLDKLGTQTGTVTRFRHKPDDPGSISFDKVTTGAISGWTSASFLEDSEHNIWIGTESGGLNKYDRETGGFTHFLARLLRQGQEGIHPLSPFAR